MSESPNIRTVVLVHGGFADASYWAPVIGISARSELAKALSGTA
jgi:pimeloyl-ACP methyl ester carboxylesterase